MNITTLTVIFSPKEIRKFSSSQQIISSFQSFNRVDHQPNLISLFSLSFPQFHIQKANCKLLESPKTNTKSINLELQYKRKRKRNQRGPVVDIGRACVAGS